MGVRKFYSKRKKKPGWKWDANKKQFWSYGFDIRLSSGRRVREAGFPTESDAITAVGIIRKGEKDQRYGFLPEAARPTLAALIEKRLHDMTNHWEKVRATRVLNKLCSLLPPNKRVDDLTTPDIKAFVEQRLEEGQAATSVNRELNIISSTLNKAGEYFPLLSQWRKPKTPRPKVSKKKRERVYTDEEREKLIKYLLSPKKATENYQAWQGRRWVGRKLQFALSVGLRHGELNHIKKDHVDWAARSLKIVGTKTEFVANPTRYISPLTDLEMEILREFAKRSTSEFVFTHGGNPSSKFYRIFRDACIVCGIPYGRKVEGGITFHDARHDVTTRMLQEGVDPATVQAQMGWSDRSMVLYYSHATPASRQRALMSVQISERRRMSKPNFQ